MRFSVIPTTEIFDFIGIYLPMVLFVIVGGLISKLIHNKIPMWISYVLGIIYTVVKVFILFTLVDCSIIYKLLVIVVFFVVAGLLVVAILDFDE